MKASGIALGVTRGIHAQASSMQIFPDVYETRSVFGNRYVQQYLFVGVAVVLLDAGVAKTPETTILPFLDKIGIRCGVRR